LGGTEIVLWQKGQSRYDSMYSQIQEATNGTMKVKSMLFYQGEDDVLAGSEYSYYKESLSNMTINFFNDTEVAEKVIIAQLGEAPENIDVNRSGSVNIMKAQLDFWNDNPTNVSGITLYDVDLVNNSYHFYTNAEIEKQAERWWATIGSVIYGVGDGRGPRVNNITFNEGDNDTLILNFTEDSLPLKIGYWNGTSSNLAEGFSFYLSNGTFANNTFIQSTEVINQNQLRVNLSINLTTEDTISLGSFNDGAGKPLVRDSSLYSLPAETFYNQTIYQISTSDTDPPTVTFLSPTSGQAVTSSSLSLIIGTNENSTCNYSTNSGTTNSSLTANSTGTGHTGILSSLTTGSYTLNTYCSDLLGNVNNTQNVSFSVSIPIVAEDSSSSSDSGSGRVPSDFTYKPTREQILNGYSKLLTKGNKVDVIGSGFDFVIEVISVSNGDGEVGFSIGENDYLVRIDEILKIDTNSDGYYDIEVSIREMRSNDYAYIEFKEIYEEIPSIEKESVEEDVEEEIELEESKSKVWVYVSIVVFILILFYFWIRSHGKFKF
jgi:hypothetical protein